MAEITVRAPAKVNLHLGVGAPRADGFHPLETVFHAVDLYDDLTVRTADRWGLYIHAGGAVAGADLPTGEDNLVTRAARLLADLHGRAPYAVVELHKRIPMAGGLAGGSADAAAALRALDRLWEARTSEADLFRLAAELGSDVPFALVGGTAVGTGRGEVLTPVADHARWWWVLVLSAEGLSTPAVYRHFDEIVPDIPAAPPPADRLLEALATGDPQRLAPVLHNDLQQAAVDLRPDLGRLIAEGEAAGALRGLVSGSGPTCAFLCESRAHAHAVADALRGGSGGRGESGGRDGVLTVSGPMLGAHLTDGATG